MEVKLESGDVIWYNGEKLGVIEEILRTNKKMIEIRITDDSGVHHKILTHKKRVTKVD